MADVDTVVGGDVEDSDPLVNQFRIGDREEEDGDKPMSVGDRGDCGDPTTTNEWWLDGVAGEPELVVVGEAVAIVLDNKSHAASTLDQDGSFKRSQYVVSCSSSFNSANVKTGVRRRLEIEEAVFRKGKGLVGGDSVVELFVTADAAPDRNVFAQERTPTPRPTATPAVSLLPSSK